MIRRRVTLLQVVLLGIIATAAAIFSASFARAQAVAAGGSTATRQSAQQPVYMPRAIRHAFSNGTRSADGRPGPRYWQNHGRYTISITTQPPDRTIRGSEQITYMNESPDTLRQLVIKLFMNIHKPTVPRGGSTSEGYLTSGIHVDRFVVNGLEQQWNDSRINSTWRAVALPAPLMPHDSVRLDFDWHYELASVAGREGMIDSTTYYVAYFYPRVAVYDDYNGWDRMNFTDFQEFYSDFNDYDVTVRVPANFVVWGTGTLFDPASVLQPDVLRRFETSLTSDQTIPVATRDQFASKSVTRQADLNAWHFVARDIPDMAFGLSDHYDWDAASVVVDNRGRRASVQAAYNDAAADFHYVVQFARHTLDWLSNNWPGVPYPYEKTTVFQGGAGMEYPMMANDASSTDTSFTRFVADHEIAHTYFPFYMGINETRYGFMDEGWATTFEYLMNVASRGQAAATAFYQRFRVNGWIHDQSPAADLPIITPEDELYLAYGNNAYGKPSLGYLALKDLLGDSGFRQVLHAFIDRWHGRHPIPWDFFNTVNDVSGQNLNWFWRSWFFDNSYIDIAVRGVRRVRGGYAVALENIGGMPAPVDLQLTFVDGSTQVAHQTPMIWKANRQNTSVTVSSSKKLTALQLAHGIWMDADTTNDRWTAR